MAAWDQGLDKDAIPKPPDARVRLCQFVCGEVEDVDEDRPGPPKKPECELVRIRTEDVAALDTRDSLERPVPCNDPSFAVEDECRVRHKLDGVLQLLVGGLEGFFDHFLIRNIHEGAHPTKDRSPFVLYLRCRDLEEPQHPSRHLHPQLPAPPPFCNEHFFHVINGGNSLSCNLPEFINVILKHLIQAFCAKNAQERLVRVDEMFVGIEDDDAIDCRFDRGVL